ncbi:MAG TPA: glutamate 5-kinase [Bacteroidales bacterium]|nr:glutamate 5-kinase [Bacteroidales bacterium]
MKNVKPEFNRITIKVGSNVITQKDGSLNDGRILRIVEDIAVLYRQGVEVLLITSGAVAAGRESIMLSRKTNIVAARQIWAAIGQVKLMSSYQFLFGKYGIQAGQLLATKDSFRDRRNYLNMKNCISAMLENRVLPIVNENDAISINELMFTDNDELSGLISSMMDCQTLIILSNVDGIYRGSPEDEGSKLIRSVDSGSESMEKFISSDKSGFGRGGMMTKYFIAKKIAAEGIDVFIANGLRDSIIADIIGGKDVPYTRFMAGEQKETGVKRWLYHSDTFAKGSVVINSGAKEALMGEKATSLLMIGITGINGFFRKGDIVRIIDEDGNYLGLGQAQYDSDKAVENIGMKLRKPFIHYDYLFIYEKNKGMIHHNEDFKSN